MSIEHKDKRTLEHVIIAALRRLYVTVAARSEKKRNKWSGVERGA